jgi:hypothetical protein
MDEKKVVKTKEKAKESKVLVLVSKRLTLN